MTSLVRQFVSKKKRRFRENGFDLDLSSQSFSPSTRKEFSLDADEKSPKSSNLKVQLRDITDRIIAMGFPAEGREGLFRNPMSEVARFLAHYHENHFKVINLCSERDYDPNKFAGNVERIPLDDHQIAPLSVMLRFCRIADDWLSQDENNVLVTHCKAGKGRSGLMICAYLLYTSYCPNPQTAVQFYGEKRTKNGKGVTIPSQQRYIGYFHDFVEKGPRDEVELQLAQISFTANVVSTKDVNVVISSITGRDSCKLMKVISTKELGIKVSSSKSGRTMVMGFSSLWICGDVRFEFHTPEAQIFYFWFNTAYIQGTEFSLLNQSELDKPSKYIELDTQVSLFFVGKRSKD